jgi:hypothetical protein
LQGECPEVNVVKGADARLLLLYAGMDTWVSHLPSELGSCLMALHAFTCECDCADEFFTRTQRARAIFAGRSYMRIWFSLALGRALSALPNDYKVRPKCHYF